MTDERPSFGALDGGDHGQIDAILAIQHTSFSTPWSRDNLVALLQSPASRVYCAWIEGEIVGFCACWLFDDELHINLIAVSAQRRRRGIGRQLVEYVLRDTAARRSTLEVRRSNVAALAMYERLGFKVTAIREHYYENPIEDALILWLNP